MEVSVRLEGSGIELTTARGEDGAEFVERGDVPIDDWAWFRTCHFWVTRARKERRSVRAGCRWAMCPVREAAGLPLVTLAGAEAVPGPAG